MRDTTTKICAQSVLSSELGQGCFLVSVLTSRYRLGFLHNHYGFGDMTRTVHCTMQTRGDGKTGREKKRRASSGVYAYSFLKLGRWSIWELEALHEDQLNTKS